MRDSTWTYPSIIKHLEKVHELTGTDRELVVHGGGEGLEDTVESGVRREGVWRGRGDGGGAENDG